VHWLFLDRDCLDDDSVGLFVCKEPRFGLLLGSRYDALVAWYGNSNRHPSIVQSFDLLTKFEHRDRRRIVVWTVNELPVPSGVELKHRLLLELAIIVGAVFFLSYRGLIRGRLRFVGVRIVEWFCTIDLSVIF